MPQYDIARLELDYRSGAYTLVELGKLHGIGKSRVHEIATRHGWKRDLRARIAIAAAAKLSEHDTRLVAAAIEAERAAEKSRSRRSKSAGASRNIRESSLPAPAMNAVSGNSRQAHCQ